MKILNNFSMPFCFILILCQAIHANYISSTILKELETAQISKNSITTAYSSLTEPSESESQDILKRIDVLQMHLDGKYRPSSGWIREISDTAKREISQLRSLNYRK